MQLQRVGRGEDGFTLMEVLVALGVVAVLMAIAIPLFVGHQNQARDAAAQSELRQVLMPLRTHLSENPRSANVAAGVEALAPTTAFDSAAVLGVRLDTAADGSTCLWRISDSGTVFGMWEPGPGVYSQALYAEVASVPASCPSSTDTAAAGFGPGGW